jgi:branched-chain amino acid transport system substrate-binding protein
VSAALAVHLIEIGLVSDDGVSFHLSVFTAPHCTTIFFLAIVIRMRLCGALPCLITAWIAFPACLLAESCRISIGLVLPLTGNAASYGERAQRGATVAQEMVRDICDVSLVFGDSRFESSGGISAYRSLMQNTRINAVITGSSQVSIPIRDIAARDGIAQMAIFTSAESFSKPDSSSFRMSSRSHDEVLPLVDVVTQAPKPQVGAIFLANDFGEAVASDFKTRLESAGVKLLASERIIPTTSDVRSEVLRMKQKGITHLLVVALPFQYVTIFRTAQELRFEPQFLSPRIIEDTTTLQANLTYGRVVYSYPFDEQSLDPAISSFVTAYRARHNTAPDAYAAEAFESVRLLTLSAARCGSDRMCASSFLRSQEFSTVFGKIRFNQEGDTFHHMFLKTIAGQLFERFVSK